MKYSKKEQLRDLQFNSGTGYFYDCTEPLFTPVEIEITGNTDYNHHAKSLKSATFKLRMDRSDEGKAEGHLIIHSGTKDQEKVEMYDVSLDAEQMFLVGNAFINAAGWIGFTEKNALVWNDAEGNNTQCCGARVKYSWCASGGDHFYCGECRKDCTKEGTKKE